MTHENFIQIIECLNNFQTMQKSSDYEFELDFEGNSDFELLTQDSDLKYLRVVELDKHRHYELGTKVYKVGDYYLGIEMIVDILSEGTEEQDCGHTYKFHEMKPVKTITYIKA